MHNVRVYAIKREQKETQLFREISQLFLQIALDDSSMRGLVVTRVKLSADKGMCSVFLYIEDGQETFKELMRTLILYKPSLRKAIATQVPSRRVPDLLFKFDSKFEKQQRIEQLLENIKTEDVS